MRFIHENFSDPIGVCDVANHLQLSRRGLELRFQKVLGRTIYAEIQRIRLERVKRLLMESELPIAKIAFIAGFGSPRYMGQVFKQQLGMTPAKYRAKICDG